MFRPTSINVEISQKVKKSIIRTNSKLFVYGTVFSSDILSVIPKFIGSSKKDYLKTLAKKSKLFFTAFMIFATISFITYINGKSSRAPILQGC